MEKNFINKIERFFNLTRLPREEKTQELISYLKASYIVRRPSFTNGSDQQVSQVPYIVENNKKLLKEKFPNVPDEVVNDLCDGFITHKLIELPLNEVKEILQDYQGKRMEAQLRKTKDKEESKKRVIQMTTDDESWLGRQKRNFVKKLFFEV